MEGPVAERRCRSQACGFWARPIRAVARWLIRDATRAALECHLHDPDTPTEGRWLRAEVSRFRRDTWRRVDALLPSAHLEALPTLGNRLNAFYHSWCLYNWAGADLLVGDGRRGHYARRQTLSRGDAVCDMCWSAGADFARSPKADPLRASSVTP